MADIFAIKNQIIKHEEEKYVIDLFRSIVQTDAEGNKNLSICFPSGAAEWLINKLRLYGFKAHNISVKDPTHKDAKACLVQW